MVKKRVDKGIDESSVEEEVKKFKKVKKERKIKNKEDKKEKKKAKKEDKKLRTNKKKEKKKRKLNKLNVFILFLSLLFIAVAVLGILIGTGVISFIPKDNGPVYYSLSKKVKVGDYVDYDAGHWEEEKGVPNESVPFTFGGYVVSSSRNKSVTCNYNETDKDGWRVFSVEEGIVTLIHNGLSMCYYHGYGSGTNDSSVAILSNQNVDAKYDYFLDDKYSESVRILSKEDIDKWYKEDSSYKRIRDDIINVGNPYWLATKNGTHYMWYVTEGGTIAVDHVGVYGVRILVNLKRNVKTTGKNKAGVWTLAEELKKEE